MNLPLIWLQQAHKSHNSETIKTSLVWTERGPIILASYQVILSPPLFLLFPLRLPSTRVWDPLWSLLRGPAPRLLSSISPSPVSEMVTVVIIDYLFLMLNVDCLTIFRIVLTLTMTWLLFTCILISSLLSAFPSWQTPFSESKLHDCFLSQSIPCVWNGRLLVNISWMYMWMNEQTPRKESLLDQTLVRLLSLRLGPPMHFLVKSSFSKNPALSTVLCSF